MTREDIVSIRILDAREERQSPSKDFLLSYGVWSQTWQEEFSAFNSSYKLSSDNFSRQDYILVIKINEDCAAVTYFQGADLSLDFWQKDSYFADWPPDVIGQICEINPRVLVCSAFTVAKKFRKQKVSDVSIADLLAAASIHYFKQTNFQLMLGNMRNSRGANHVVYKFGAELLRTVECKSEPSDLVLFNSLKLANFPDVVQKLIAQAWTHEQTLNISALAA